MDKLRDFVYQSIGQASMCWQGGPKGVFDSAAASQIASDLLDVIAEHERDAVHRERALWLSSHPLNTHIQIVAQTGKTIDDIA